MNTMKEISHRHATLAAFADEAGGELERQIAALSDNGISLLEIRGVDGKNIADYTVKELAPVKAALDAAGIRVWSVGSPIGKVKLADDFSAELARFERVLENAVFLGASCIRLFSFYGTDALEQKAAEAEVIRRLDAFLTLAAPTGVTLCHENEKGIFGDSPARCLALHKALPALKAVFDPANFIQCGVDPAAAWPQLAPYVHYLHIKDALAAGTVVPAGYGIGGLSAIIADFLAGGGEVLTLEPHLFAFKGLSALSASDAADILRNTRFATDREAFDFAVSALKTLLAAL